MSALGGLRVIDLGQMVSAPYCAKLFADYGADVIKVQPLDGDIARRWGPFPQDQAHAEKSGTWATTQGRPLPQLTCLLEARTAWA